MKHLGDPEPFPGTPEEAAVNRSTHRWVSDGMEPLVCVKCDAGFWSVAAEYPCGTKVPRS